VRWRRSGSKIDSVIVDVLDFSEQKFSCRRLFQPGTDVVTGLVLHLLAGWMHDYFDQPYADIADDIDALLAWACWAVPLLVAEPLIQLRRVRKGRAAVA
jgi:hypothetical protein